MVQWKPYCTEASHGAGYRHRDSRHHSVSMRAAHSLGISHRHLYALSYRGDDSRARDCRRRPELSFAQHGDGGRPGFDLHRMRMYGMGSRNRLSVCRFARGPFRSGGPASPTCGLTTRCCGPAHVDSLSVSKVLNKLAPACLLSDTTANIDQSCGHHPSATSRGVIVFIVVWFFVLRLVRRQTRQISQAIEQRRVIQEKLDRIIALLEERNRGVITSRL